MKAILLIIFFITSVSLYSLGRVPHRLFFEDEEYYVHVFERYPLEVYYEERGFESPFRACKIFPGEKPLEEFPSFTEEQVQSTAETFRVLDKRWKLCLSSYRGNEKELQKEKRRRLRGVTPGEVYKKIPGYSELKHKWEVVRSILYIIDEDYVSLYLVAKERAGRQKVHWKVNLKADYVRPLPPVPLFYRVFPTENTWYKLDEFARNSDVAENSWINTYGSNYFKVVREP